MVKSRLYKVTFINEGKMYEVFAKEVSQSSLLGFVEVGDFVFDEGSSVVIDPSEERLKREFEGIKRSYLPLQAIIRIDEVEKRGISKISDIPKNGNVITAFPSSGLMPPKNESDNASD